MTIDVGIVKKIDAVDDKALLGCRQTFKHLVSFGNAGMFLNDVVAGTGWVVVPVRPDGGTWIVWEERSQKLVAIVSPERIGANTYGIAHRIRSLARCCRCGAIWICWICLCWRNELNRRTGLIGPTRRAELCWVAGRTNTGLVRSLRSTTKDRHDDEP